MRFFGPFSPVIPLLFAGDINKGRSVVKIDRAVILYLWDHAIKNQNDRLAQ